MLAEETIGRALRCLEMFSQRLREVPAHGVRAVGTSTARKATNSRDFLTRARAALGHPIEIVSGREEARLIYLGVAHSIADDVGRRLVVDIGGGSTECILGERFEALVTDSLEMGCVSYSSQFFENGDLKKDAFRDAETAAARELQPMERRYRTMGWDTCVGASGTILAVAEILRLNGFARQGVTPGGLDKLKKAMLAAGKVSRLTLTGLKPDRAPVLAAGVAILSAVVDTLGIKRMTSTAGALREGLLYDQLGRIRHEDVRDRTIARLGERYHVDAEQAARVERTALQLLRQAAGPWALDAATSRQLLAWAARLHEIGMVVSYSGYHKHGAYLVANTDMPGFSRDEQAVLAELIRTHRRKLAVLFRDVPPLKSELALRLAILLRLAVLLNRSRTTTPLPQVALKADKQALALTFPPRWLDEHTLTRVDLETEADELAAIGWTLGVKSAGR